MPYIYSFTYRLISLLVIGVLSLEYFCCMTYISLNYVIFEISIINYLKRSIHCWLVLMLKQEIWYFLIKLVKVLMQQAMH